MEKALDYIFSTNDWMIQRSKDEIDNVKVKLKSIIQSCGKFYDYELITNKSIGESLYFSSYLVKYDRLPLRFTFIFYKPKGIWKLYNFKFDQDLTDELEESGKLYRLKEINYTAYLLRSCLNN